MKKFIIRTAALLLPLLCTAGCGASGKAPTSDIIVSVESVNNMTDEELKNLFTGAWKTSVVFIDNQDGIQFDIDTYEFLEDGTGTYFPENGSPQALSWTVTTGGDMDVVFEENGEKDVLFEYISGNLVSLERIDGKTVETHLYKIVMDAKEIEEQK